MTNLVSDKREGAYDISSLKKGRLFTKKIGKLYREGQKMKYAYLILNGAVTLTGKSPEGQRVVLHEAQAGEVLGVQALQNKGRSTHSAFIKKTSSFLAIQLTAISAQIENLPSFRDALAKQLISHLDVLENIICFS